MGIESNIQVLVAYLDFISVRHPETCRKVVYLKARVGGNCCESNGNSVPRNLLIDLVVI
jgi:hypothetical protein